MAGSDIVGGQVPIDRMPGHWVLARMGKRVLRPGGRELTDQLLASLAISASDDVIEVAPGLGSTTELVLAANPASYIGVERDPGAATRIDSAFSGPNRSVIEASATDTGLRDATADVAFGEAYLTMQTASLKQRIVEELARVLRPGGRIGLHEVAFAADADDNRQSQVAKALTTSIGVNVTPLSAEGWEQLLVGAGFVVQSRFSAPLHLLEPRRLIADEGIAQAARFVANVARDSQARKRVLAMRSAMRSNAAYLQAYSLVAVKPAP